MARSVLSDAKRHTRLISVFVSSAFLISCGGGQSDLTPQLAAAKLVSPAEPNGQVEPALPEMQATDLVENKASNPRLTSVSDAKPKNSNFIPKAQAVSFDFSEIAASLASNFNAVVATTSSFNFGATSTNKASPTSASITIPPAAVVVPTPEVTVPATKPVVIVKPTVPKPIPPVTVTTTPKVISSAPVIMASASVLDSPKTPITSTTVTSVKPPTVTAASNPALKLKGINLSGGEFAWDNPLAKLNWQYTYPSRAQIDYYASKGFTVIRLPVSGTRIQPINNSELNATEITNIQNVIDYSATKNLQVIIDPHDYGQKYDSTSKTMKILGVANGLPASHFADFWYRLATKLKPNSNVIFGLMNEPHFQTAAQWHDVAVQGINAIRSSGAKQKILISGTNYSGAHDWVSSGNGAAWADFTDPENNFAFEVHQYLDSDNSGTHSICVVNKGATVLTPATNWARQNRVKLFLGEIGWSDNSACPKEGAAIMNFMTQNADVWSGWTYWGGGLWYPKDYMFALDPLTFVLPIDRPQMRVLLNNL